MLGNNLVAGKTEVMKQSMLGIAHRPFNRLLGSIEAHCWHGMHTVKKTPHRQPKNVKQHQKSEDGCRLDAQMTRIHAQGS